MPFTGLQARGPPQFRSDDISDPLTRQLLATRRDETEEQRLRREYEERQALKRSREIDEWLKAEKPKDRKKKKVAKVLLVGQSESGKSTTLKNFQLHYAPKAFQAERSRWKTVILLNLVRSLRKIHEALTNYSASQGQGRSHTHPTPHSTPISSPMVQKKSFDFSGTPVPDEDDEEFDIGMAPHRRRLRLTPQHRLLLLRLRPALALESQLLRTLIAESSQPTLTPSGSFPEHQRSSSHLDWYTNWRNEVPDDYPPSLITPSSSLSPSSIISQPHTPNTPAPTPPFILSDEVVVPAGWNQVRSHTPTPRSGLDDLVDFVSGGNSLTRTPDVLQPFPRARRPNDPPTRSVSSSRQMSFSKLAPSMEVDGHIENGVDNYIGRPIEKDTTNWDSSIGSSFNPSTKGSSNGAPMARSPTPSSMGSPAEIPERILAACAVDILALWRDEIVRTLLCGPLWAGGLGLKLHEDSGFFLDDVERVTAPNYIPTDDDVLRARLKTMGVSEHRFVLEDSIEFDSDYIKEMVVYDVGGSRTQRHQWINFFDDVNVIIFLAPISAFDQRLTEDSNVNRLQDTFNLWKDITKSKALGKVDFLVFLNKCDLLEAKMKAGLKLRKFIPQYNGDDTLPDAIKFFRGVFMGIWQKNSAALKQHTKHSRALHLHATSMIDYKTSRTVIQSVQTCAFNTNLKEAMVI